MRYSHVNKKLLVENADLRKAVARGQILGTLSDAQVLPKADLSVPALTMRKSIEIALSKESPALSRITRTHLKAVASVSGWSSFKRFPKHRRGEAAKAFESYHLHVEAARWSLHSPTIATLSDFYRIAVCRKGDLVNAFFEFVNPGIIVRLPAEGSACFPSASFDKALCTAFGADMVAKAVDVLCCSRSTIIPEYQCQEGFDYIYGVRTQINQNIVIAVDNRGASLAGI